MSYDLTSVKVAVLLTERPERDATVDSQNGCIGQAPRLR
jgi:hypothetical protein